MLVKVKVTQEDIDTGVRGSCTVCPVARAVNRVLKEGFHATVDPYRIYIRQSFEILQDIGTPIGASCFINAFDQRLSVSPFEFDIDINEDFLANIGA